MIFYDLQTFNGFMKFARQIFYGIWFDNGWKWSLICNFERWSVVLDNVVVILFDNVISLFFQNVHSMSSIAKSAYRAVGIFNALLFFIHTILYSWLFTFFNSLSFKICVMLVTMILHVNALSQASFQFFNYWMMQPAFFFFFLVWIHSPS